MAFLSSLGERLTKSLTGQTLVIVGAFDLELGRVDRVVGFHAARKTGALHALRPQIIKRLDAQFPGTEVEHEQIPFFHISRDEQVQRLRLIDIGGAVGREFEQPALVDFEAGLERVLFFLAQEVEMLDAAAMFEDRVPDIIAVLRLLDQQLFEIGILDREAARQRLVRIDIGRDRLALYLARAISGGARSI